jgi:hypothetical protein
MTKVLSGIATMICLLTATLRILDLKFTSQNNMTVFPDKLKMIHQYSSEERMFILNLICAEMYIARNISMNQDAIIKNLERIDRLYRTPSEGEEYES